MKNINKILVIALIASCIWNLTLYLQLQENEGLVNVQKIMILKLHNEKVSKSNEIHFVWEGLEKDIPKDGDVMLNLSTNENTVFINPVDK